MTLETVTQDMHYVSDMYSSRLVKFEHRDEETNEVNGTYQMQAHDYEAMDRPLEIEVTVRPKASTSAPAEDV